jgi:hypothetical protein
MWRVPNAVRERPGFTLSHRFPSTLQKKRTEELVDFDFLSGIIQMRIARRPE